MKNYKISLLCTLLCLAFSSCAGEQTEEQEEASETQSAPAVFDTLRCTGGENITADFTITPNKNNTQFLYVTATKNMDVQLKYSFTKDAGNVEIGYCKEKGGESVTIPLDSAAVHQETTNEISLPLKKGMNVFYITGNSSRCTLHCELSGFDAAHITYYGTEPDPKQVNKKR